MSIGACLVVFIGHKDQNKQHWLRLQKKKMVINMLVLYPEARKEKRTKHSNDIFQFNVRPNAVTLKSGVRHFVRGLPNIIH